MSKRLSLSQRSLTKSERNARDIFPTRIFYRISQTPEQIKMGACINSTGYNLFKHFFPIPLPMNYNALEKHFIDTIWFYLTFSNSIMYREQHTSISEYGFRNNILTDSFTVPSAVMVSDKNCLDFHQNPIFEHFKSPKKKNA